MFSKARLAVFAAAICALSQSDVFRRADIKVVGSIEYGQPSEPVRYTGHPKYSALQFNAKPGDHLDITVNAKSGHLVGFLTDDAFHKLAGGERHFTAAIRADSKPSTFYILVTNTDGRPVTFTVDLERPSAAAEPLPPQGDRAAPDATQATGNAPDYLSCTEDSQCIAVERAGCCHNGWKDAVNKDRLTAYQEANACKDRRTMCAMYMVNDDRVPKCDNGKHQCVMVKPDSKP